MKTNALWLTHISVYRQNPYCLVSAEQIMNIKNRRRELLLSRYAVPLPHMRLEGNSTAQRIMLSEGRASKLYWKKFAALLPVWCNFRARKPGSDDMVNHLLDIGYRRITVAVRKILEKYNVPPALGIIHVARKTNSAPLAYDLVEMFRADVVEMEVLKFFRMKKRPMEILKPQDIAIFLNRINRRLSRRYYIKSFKQCQAYQYYMELQILKLIKAVNHGEVFEPIHLPFRHDIRC